jgi:hypothetical protein
VVLDFLVEHSLICDASVADLDKKLVEWKEDLGKASSKGSLRSLLKLRHIFSAMDRITNLSGCLTPLGNTTSPYQEKISEYTTKIVPRRNKLAHVILKKDNGENTLKGSEQFNIEDLATLRKELIEHRKNFSTVAVLLDVKF